MMNSASFRPYPLRDLILEKYRDAPQASAGEQPMETEDLLDYLAGIERLDIHPLQAVIEQTDAIGDPALPGSLQARILAWVGETLDYWYQQFGLEPSLADRLRMVTPMIAAIAVTQPDFLIAGKHPIHRLLDEFHDYTIGWQPTLGRAGDVVQSKVNETIDQLLTYFDNRNIDIESILSDLSKIAERDRSRAQRMAQRVSETEHGRLKAAAARSVGAGMINDLLLQYGLPIEVGKFLKGPWYDSVQLILLKFGRDSEQWRQLQELTATLVDSMQPSREEDEDRQQYLQDIVTRIPPALKRWLVSLHHDPGAADMAIRPIEVCHLRILRKQGLQLTHIEPLALPEQSTRSGVTPAPSIAALQEGQWFRIKYGPDDILRVQLTLKTDSEEQLIFTNIAGMKALQLSYTDFGRLLGEKRAHPLQRGTSFTRSMHRAAGIASDKAFLAILRKEEDEARRIQAQRADAERREQEARERKVREEAERVARLEAERLAREEEERKRAEEEARKAREEAVRKMQEAAEFEAREEIAAAEQRYLKLRKHARHLRRNPGKDVDLSKSMGAWMGFHDGGAPMMARLVVHDPDKDVYIFVNREGIKLREIDSQQLISLVDRGLVDIIESQSDFRKEVALAQADLGDHPVE
jgi:Protein of unknown function (DUF1631)